MCVTYTDVFTTEEKNAWHVNVIKTIADKFVKYSHITLKINITFHNPQTHTLTDYFSVTLVKNRSALEIGHSGAYLLSIQDSAIILHWRTGAIAHHWPRKSVVKLNMEKEREGKLVLVVNR